VTVHAPTKHAPYQGSPLPRLAPRRPARSRNTALGQPDERERLETADAAARAAAGDSDALAYLYSRYADGVYAYARRIVDDEYEAEDITQQVFLKLMTARANYDPSRAHFVAWILRVTRNAAIDHLRHNRALVVEAPFDVRPEAEAADPETTQSLRFALAGLSQAQRRVLVLRQIVGLTPEEVAERLGKSNGAVHTLYHRARIAARQALTGLDIAPVAMERTAA
jgi:RNA polymerase sigma-70 factor (ECF subfamily)